MSLLAPSSLAAQIEDRIDAVAQKYRLQRMLRGAMLWVTGIIVATFIGALSAHFLGQSVGTYVVLGTWIGWVVLSGAYWILGPLVFRPDPVEVARLIESRVNGLHNGLTNGLLLARRDDIANSPWLAEIYSEIATTASTRPLGEAFKIADLRPLGIILLCIMMPLVAIPLIFHEPFRQGWLQLRNPLAFVPKIGSASRIQVEPRDVTIVAGQPLEISIFAACTGNPRAKLIFEKTAGSDAAAEIPANIELTGTAYADTAPASADAQSPREHFDLQYSERIEHVDQPMRYRVEVGGTQSDWYTVTLVHQVKLEQLEFHFIPPPYTGQQQSDLVLKAADIAKANILVPQGTRVELAASVDLPASGVMFDMAPREPLQMMSQASGRRFSASFNVLDEMPVGLLISLGGKQIVGRLPEQPLVIHCAKDQPPTIEMKWPTQDVSVPVAAELKLHALLRDDYGVASVRVLMAVDGANPGSAGTDLAVVNSVNFPSGTGAISAKDFTFVLPIKPELRKNGTCIRVQLEATDNRDLGSSDGGRQTVTSSIFTIKLEEAAPPVKEQSDGAEKLRERLTEMLKKQRGLHDQMLAIKWDDLNAFGPIASGQGDLRMLMKTTAESFQFEKDELVVQKVLLKLSFEEAKDAVDQATALQTEPAAQARRNIHEKLGGSQRHIIDALETLLASLSPRATTQPSTKEGNDPLLSAADRLKKLDEALKQYIKKEQQILNQTTSLAKKPVDNWDDADKKKLEELKMAQEKLDAFMQEKLHDFSKNSEQDMANSSLLKQLMEVYSETTMAKDALNKKAAELAVAAEENGIDNAKTLDSNLEKWLANTPDRTKITQEDPLGKTDLNMPELPKELEDLVGKLLEQQEDLFEEMEDANANWAASMNKGVGWDATDGPIASMNAQGVTGNQLPNNNEMNGRSGEGRSGKSQGEFVEDHATGKGGRNTPTRLDPTPFQKGQIKDDSKDPTGGATGGGKTSGQGGEGLEGPVAPKQKMEMERLADKQAQIRNAAERLSLQYKVGKYDNFKLDEAIALMRRIESDVHANRYKNALRKRDITLDALDTSRLMVAGEVHVERDTTPAAGKKMHDKINDAMKGELIPGWSDVLKEYYRRLGQQ